MCVSDLVERWKEGIMKSMTVLCLHAIGGELPSPPGSEMEATLHPEAYASWVIDQWFNQQGEVFD